MLTGRALSDQGQPLAGANVSILNSASRSERIRPAISRSPSRPLVCAATVVLRARAIGYEPQRARSLWRRLADGQLRSREGTSPAQRSRRHRCDGRDGADQAAVHGGQARHAQMPVAGSNPLTQLQGKIPGAMIVSATGRPGAAPSIVLRGPVSLNATGRSQRPLYLLDGVPLQGSLPDINPATSRTSKS